MITGTAEEWAVQLVKECVCGDRYNQHINGKGPCTVCRCLHFEEKP